MYTCDCDKIEEIKRTEKFRSTNGIWNDLKLNQAWVVGLTTPLAKDSRFLSIPDFEGYYYAQGKERRDIILTLPIEKQDILMDYTAHVNNRPVLSLISPEEKSLNENYGRTKAELEEFARYFFIQIQKAGNPLGITRDEATLYVVTRVIYETAKGILRERNTAKYINENIPGITLKDVPGRVDSYYAIDYEIFSGKKLIAALQIKPASYQKGAASYINEAKDFNAKKNKKYTDRFGVPVIYAFAEQNGEVLNGDCLRKIREAVKNGKQLLCS